jgi:hypothetical protein
MKLFVQLAVILAFAAPVFAQAADSVSHPHHRISAKKKAKKGKKKDATKDEKKEGAGETAAPAEEGGKM